MIGRVGTRDLPWRGGQGWFLGSAESHDRGEGGGCCSPTKPRRGGLGKRQAVEVTINQVNHQLINCRPPASRHLREENIDSHFEAGRGKAFSLPSELQQIYDRAFQTSASPW